MRWNFGLCYSGGMGHWGPEPWANDSAADWYDALFRSTQLAEHIELTLTLDLADHCDEVRAAAYLLLVLGRHETWPDDSRERCISIAIDQLNRALDQHLYTYPDIVKQVRGEIRLLNQRLRSGESGRRPKG